MIKNLIFDLGGVITQNDHDEAVRRFEQLGLKDAAEQLNPYRQKGIFGDLEIGKITAAQFQEELGELIGRTVSYEECRHAWLGYIHSVPEIHLQALRKLRAAGFRVVLMSNTNPFIQDWAESGEFDGKGNPISSYFDALYKSFEVGLMKPDPSFFIHILSKEKMMPEETLFVDDGPRNVAAGSQIGLHTICPDPEHDWVDEVYQLTEIEKQK